MSRRIYIAGPMTGHYGFNFHMFDRAAHDLAEKGWEPINPAQMDREVGFDPYRDKPDAAFLQAALERDCAALINDAEAMAMLPGWENSTGARGEFGLAQWKHIPVYQWPDMTLIEDMPPRTDRKTNSDFRNMTAQERKQRPVATGVLDYFPDALVELAHCSWVGNEQHNPGTSMRWDRSKSGDESDALIRHFLERGTVDSDGIRHSAKAAWRALALLQKEIEAERLTSSK